MEIYALEKMNRTKAARDVLAAFLRSTIATLRYGHTVIYEGEEFYVPYMRNTYKISENGESATFLVNKLSMDVMIYGSSQQSLVQLNPLDMDEEFIIDGGYNDADINLEIEKKMHLDKRMRKTITRFKPQLIDSSIVYVREPIFYVKGRDTYVFAVDSLADKVDFQNIIFIKQRIAENYLNKQKLSCADCG